MSNGQNYGNIDRLIEDFVKVHNNDYLSLQPYIAYLRAAYALGVSDGQVRRSRSVIRSDGKEYSSITIAAEKNKVHKAGITTSIRNKHKCRGYYWKYKR